MVYAPRLFSIKGKPSCKDDARHLLRSIQLSRYLSVEHKLIVDPVIQRNAYFAYPENLLLSMTTEIIMHIRELEIRRILKGAFVKSSIICATFQSTKTLVQRTCGI